MTHLAAYVRSTELAVILPAEIANQAENYREQDAPPPDTTPSIYIPDSISAQAARLLIESEIPLLPAAKIGSGLIDVARLPPIPADLIEWSDDGGEPGPLVYSFAFGDATPKSLGFVEGTVKTVQVVILEPFNGLGASLQVGDETAPDRLMQSDQNAPSMAVEYESNPNYNYSPPTEIFLSIVPGAGCTQGAGYVLLEV